MQITIVEMPAEGTWKVTLDGDKIGGYISLAPDGRYNVYPSGKASVLRTRPLSREAASMLLLYQHFTNERKTITATTTTTTTEEATVSG